MASDCVSVFGYLISMIYIKGLRSHLSNVEIMYV